MDSLTCQDSNKGPNFEDLSREDLIKKCYHLLSIAQKAKQAKSSLSEDNSKLKEELSNALSANNASREILEQLTNQKLSLLTSNEDMKIQINCLSKKLRICDSESINYRDKLNSCDNENISYKRQIRRLTEENEQLLTNLDTLEKEIETLNRIGVEQHHQLLQLENKEQEDKNQNKTDSEKNASELHCMLGVSLEEVKRLKIENNSLSNKNEELRVNLSEKDENILVISEELTLKTEQANKLTNEMKELYQMIDLNYACENLVTFKEKFEEILRSSAMSEDLKNVNVKLKDKLKSCHSKLKKLTATTKNLREDTNIILSLLKSYTSQVTIWKNQFSMVEGQILKQVVDKEAENQRLREYVEMLGIDSNKLGECVDQTGNQENNIHEINKKNKIEILSLQKKVEEMQFTIEFLKSEQECVTKESEDVKKEYLHKIDDLGEQKEELIEELNELKNKIENYESELKILNDENTDILKTKTDIEKSNVELTKNLEQSSQFCGMSQAEVDALLTERTALLEDLRQLRATHTQLKKDLEDTSINLGSSTNTVNNIADERVNILKELDDAKKNLIIYQEECKQLEEEKSSIINHESDLLVEVQLLSIENAKLTSELNEKAGHMNALVEKSLDTKSDDEQRLTELSKQIKSSEELCNRSSEEIKNLADENRALTLANEQLQDRLAELEELHLNVSDSQCQTENFPGDLEDQINHLKRENAELLSEMNEMNQAIKERGENISKLEAHCEEILKKLQIYETQANKNNDDITTKEKLIEVLKAEIESYEENRTNFKAGEEIASLKNEIEALKEKLNCTVDSSYADNETMSTSTISRADESNRLKDLEGSWEERYGKLRNLAIKLKGKIRELTNTLTQQQTENEELHKKLAANVKIIQNLQNQSDKLQDELDVSKKDCKEYLNRLSSVANEISKDKQLLVSKEDIISELKQRLDHANNEQKGTENWKKQISTKVQTLRQEVEANKVLKKEMESKISKLTNELQAKEESLKVEIDNHRQTKNLLDQSLNECKKNSVLNLEMQDYERSGKETSKKLEKQREQLSVLKAQVESQKTTISALREQNKLLEERADKEEEKAHSIMSETDSYKKKITDLEEQIKLKEDKAQSLSQLLEVSRSETEELSTELSKVIAEHQKTNNILKSERDHVRSQLMGLQQSSREMQDALKLRTDELRTIQAEYEGYKVRAQSVLRQNQNRDVGLEEKLSEENASLLIQNCQLTSHLNDNKEKLKNLEIMINELSSEKESYLKHKTTMDGLFIDLKNEFTQLSAKYEKTLGENAETVRSLKVHADTLTQCYRQQIAEQEAQHNREIIELQSRLEKAPTPTEPIIVLPTMAREEGEGSESIDSNNIPNTQPVPLERLLGSDTEHNIERIKRKVHEQESKLVHLTALLSDTEKDLIKHIQMNELLKEEIRRHQRSMEREEHAENLEYLKNVVYKDMKLLNISKTAHLIDCGKEHLSYLNFGDLSDKCWKFVTLNSGDERSRLVPVLNTILKLSPEEAKHLNIVAKGEIGLKGWTNYLPTWPSPSKPQ